MNNDETIINYFKSIDSLENALNNVVEILQKRLIANLQTFKSEKIGLIPEGPGCYLFCAVGEKESVKEAWFKYSDQKENLPPFISSRFTKCSDLRPPQKIFPFYIGKSANLSRRIQEHFDEDDLSSTKALRLKNFLIQNSNIEIMMSYINMSLFGMTEKNYFVCSALESRLRNNLNPMIGR